MNIVGADACKLSCGRSGWLDVCRHVMRRGGLRPGQLYQGWIDGLLSGRSSRSEDKSRNLIQVGRASREET